VSRPIVASCVVAALAVAVLPAAAGAKKPAANTPFSGKICPIPTAGELKAAHISDRCVQFKTAKRARRHSPLGGTLGTIVYAARWGRTSGVGGEAHHFLTVFITKLVGSGNALVVARKELRLKILAHGFPVAVGKPGSVDTGTASCPNPPTDDCTTGDVLAMKGNYVLHVGLGDAPPTVQGAPHAPDPDEGQDNQQEDAVKAPVTAIAKAIAAKLK